MLPSHNSTFVYTNDSAYSNFSATVGEDLHFILFCICQAWMVLVSLDSKLTLSFGSVGHVVKIYVYAEINDWKSIPSILSELVWIIGRQIPLLSSL